MANRGIYALKNLREIYLQSIWRHCIIKVYFVKFASKSHDGWSDHHRNLLASVLLYICSSGINRLILQLY